MAKKNSAVVKFPRKTDLARQYRDEYGMEMPTLKLARIMFNDNKLLFRNVEEARVNLRYIEGKATLKTGGHVTHKTPDRPRNPYALPESDETEYKPFKLTGHKRVAVFSDVHLPYHSIEAITAAFDYAKKEKPDAIFLNGDILDFYSVSHFCRDPRMRKFADELKMFKEFFTRLQKIFNCKIYYKIGNHEERYEKFLFQKAHELVGVEEFELESIIKARAEGIEVIKDKKLVVMNGLPFIHGHEFGRGVFSPVNAARGLFLQAKHSCVKGDCHTSSEHTEPNIFGKICAMALFVTIKLIPSPLDAG